MAAQNILQKKTLIDWLLCTVNQLGYKLLDKTLMGWSQPLLCWANTRS